MRPPPPTQLSLVSVSLVVALCVLAGCQPKSKPGVVVGGSMAPAFLGKHLRVSCPACRYVTRCNPTLPPSRTFLVCPHCGFEEVAIAKGSLQPADQVVIHPGSHSIARWDVIAFQIPDSTIAGIKRVVGLPNEHLRIVDGNLLIDGRLLRKPIPQQKEMRILVNDSRHTDEPRWTPWTDESAWQANSDGFHFQPQQPTRTFDWIAYRPRRCYPHREPDSAPALIEDNYEYNPTLGRDLNPTVELYVAIDITLEPETSIGWQFEHRSNHYEFRINADQSELLAWGFESDAPLKLPIPPSSFDPGDFKLEFSSFDEQFIVLIDGKTIFQHSLNPSSGPAAPFPLKFGAVGRGAAIDRIQIWRDIFYLPSPGTLSHQDGLQSSQNGFLVLGDNVPVSIDSRHWNSPSIEPQNVLGRVSLTENK